MYVIVIPRYEYDIIVIRHESASMIICTTRANFIIRCASFLELSSYSLAVLCKIKLLYENELLCRRPHVIIAFFCSSKEESEKCFVEKVLEDIILQKM